MIIDDVELGMQVMCSNLLDTSNITDVPNFHPESKRELGWVGRVTAVYPLQNLVYVTYLLGDGTSYVEHTSTYFAEELEAFDPIPLIAPDSPLRKAIKHTLTRITKK